MVHELVKRGLEGDRLMELLPGWEKVSQATPLSPPKIYSDIRARRRGILMLGGKRTRNAGMNCCKLWIVGALCWDDAGL